MTISSAGPFNPQSPLVAPSSGMVTSDQSAWFLRLSAQLQSLSIAANNSFGTNFFATTNQPSLGAGDVGYVGFVTDFGHLVYWDGSAWQWLDGDRPLRFSDFGADPGAGWGLCDGTTYDYLVVGATLTTASLATPDLAGTAAYKKTGAAYTGTIVGATAPGLSGSTASESSHTHDEGTLAMGLPSGTGGVHDGGGILLTFGSDVHHHTISGTTSAGSAHSHGVGTLAVDATGQPARLVVLPYVRL